MRERIFHKILNTRRKIVADAAIRGSLKTEFRLSGCLSLNVLSWWFCDRAFFLYYNRTITILSRTFIHCLTGCLSSIVCKFRNEITTPFISTLGKTHARIAIFCKNSTRLFLPILAILQSFLPSLSC